MTTIISHSPKETEEIGFRIAKLLKGKEVIALYGDLGMGKTVFVRGLAKGLNSKDTVSSPTFALINQYDGDFSIYHFDMYRISSWDDLYSIGYFDILNTGILAIEWSENIEGALPDDLIKIEISFGINDNERIVKIDGVEFI